jgi:type IX secretion system substrate protein/carboxypeptidase family protein/Big-like domain-containing protein
MKKAILLTLVGAAMSVATYAIGPIIGATSTCVGIGWTVKVTDVTTGGAWSSSNSSIASVDPSTGVVTGIAPGTCTISYCVGTETTSVVFTVNPAATITGPTSVCDGMIDDFVGYPGAGQWTTTSPTEVNIDPLFTFSTDAKIQFHSTGGIAIYYTVGGCYAIQYVTSNPSPAPFCGCYKQIRIGEHYTYTNPVPGGTWSCDNTYAASIDPVTGVVTGLNYGNCKIYYAYAGGCAAYSNLIVCSCSGDQRMGSSITGNVTNGGAATPVAYLPVDVIDNTTGATVVTTQTDATGTYSATDLPDGSYSVNPTYPGYTTTTGSAIISAATPTANINFQKSSGKIAPASTYVAPVSADKGFAVYPNPTSGNLNITWENQSTGNATISVTDVIGRQVFQSAININAAAGQTQVDLSNLVNGIYFVSVKSNSINSNTKIQISK